MSGGRKKPGPKPMDALEPAENAVFKDRFMRAIFTRSQTTKCNGCLGSRVTECGQAYSTTTCAPVNEYYCASCWNAYAAQIGGSDKKRWYIWACEVLELRQDCVRTVGN